jgi:hypothetical protein
VLGDFWQQPAREQFFHGCTIQIGEGEGAKDDCDFFQSPAQITTA